MILTVDVRICHNNPLNLLGDERILQELLKDFHDGPVVKTLPANAGHRFNLQPRKIPQAAGQLSLCTTILSPRALELVHHNKRSHRNKPSHHN